MPQQSKGRDKPPEDADYDRSAFEKSNKISDPVPVGKGKGKGKGKGDMRGKGKGAGSYGRWVDEDPKAEDRDGRRGRREEKPRGRGGKSDGDYDGYGYGKGEAKGYKGKGKGKGEEWGADDESDEDFDPEDAPGRRKDVRRRRPAERTASKNEDWYEEDSAAYRFEVALGSCPVATH